MKPGPRGGRLGAVDPEWPAQAPLPTAAACAAPGSVAAPVHPHPGCRTPPGPLQRRHSCLHVLHATPAPSRLSGRPLTLIRHRQGHLLEANGFKELVAPLKAVDALLGMRHTQVTQVTRPGPATTRLIPSSPHWHPLIFNRLKTQQLVTSSGDDVERLYPQSQPHVCICRINVEGDFSKVFKSKRGHSREPGFQPQ